jgi:IS5 family transposase
VPASGWQTNTGSAPAAAGAKLHLAVDASSGQIVGVTLSDQDVDDASQVEPLLGQIPGEIEQFTADGAYDGEPPTRPLRRATRTSPW